MSDLSDVEEEELGNPLGQYEGERDSQDRRHGAGRVLFSNGDYYEGCYSKNLRHGHGTYVFANKNGARYVGDYRFGFKSGKGIFYYEDGSKYEGEWKKDSQHGCGIYKYVNGDTYSGAWYKGKRHGIGTYTYAAGGVKVISAWDMDEIAGGGRVEYPMSGVSFHGSFEKHKPVGKGVFVFPRLNCMQLGVYERKTVEPPPREEDTGEEVEGEFNEKPKAEGPPSLWFAKDVVAYDEALMPPRPQPRQLPDVVEDESERSASLESENSEQEEGAWSIDEELGEEEHRGSSIGEFREGLDVMSSNSRDENMGVMAP